MAIDWGGWAETGADALGGFVPGGQFVDEAIGAIGDLFGFGGDDTLQSVSCPGAPPPRLVRAAWNAASRSTKERIRASWRANNGRPMPEGDFLLMASLVAGGYDCTIKSPGERELASLVAAMVDRYARSVRQERVPSQPTGTPSQGSSPTTSFPRPGGIETTPQPLPVPTGETADGGGMSTSMLLILAGVGILGFYLLTESGLGD